MKASVVFLVCLLLCSYVIFPAFCFMETVVTISANELNKAYSSIYFHYPKSKKLTFHNSNEWKITITHDIVFGDNTQYWFELCLHPKNKTDGQISPSDPLLFFRFQKYNSWVMIGLSNGSTVYFVYDRSYTLPIEITYANRTVEIKGALNPIKLTMFTDLYPHYILYRISHNAEVCTAGSVTITYSDDPMETVYPFIGLAIMIFILVFIFEFMRRMERG